MSLPVFLFIDIFAIKHLTLRQRDSSLFTFHSSFFTKCEQIHVL